MTNQTQTAPAVFQFQENSIRTVEINHEAWFYASDVAKTLDYHNTNDLTRILEDYEADTHNVRVRSENGVEQNREISIINESGIYSAILKSRKPEAKAFKKWVTCEVLPQIRKTGGYLSEADRARFEQLEQNVDELMRKQRRYDLDPKIARLFDYASEAQEHCEQFFVNVEILRHKHAVNLNHHRRPNFIAINLNEYLSACEQYELPCPHSWQLKLALPYAKNPLFIEKSRTICSAFAVNEHGKPATPRCWVFTAFGRGGES